MGRSSVEEKVSFSRASHVHMVGHVAGWVACSVDAQIICRRCSSPLEG
jgi:hypothetical protein